MYVAIINPRRSRAARATVVCVSVCLSVDAYSAITGYEVTNEQYQRLQNYANLKKY